MPHGCPPLTRDLWPQRGCPQTAWQGFVCAASVCSMSNANKVLVLRRRQGGTRHDPVHLWHSKSSWGVQGGLTCIRPHLWKHSNTLQLSLSPLNDPELQGETQEALEYRGHCQCTNQLIYSPIFHFSKYVTSEQLGRLVSVMGSAWRGGAELA